MTKLLARSVISSIERRRVVLALAATTLLLWPAGRRACAAEKLTYPDLATAARARVPPGVTAIVTLAFRVSGDGGGAQYRAVGAADPPPPEASRGHSWFADRSGRIWSIDEPVVSAAQVGARGDGAADDTDALRALAALGGDLRVPATAAFYRLTDEIVMRSGSRLLGTGGRPLLRQTTPGRRALIGVDCSSIEVSNLRVEGAGAAIPFSSGPDEALISFRATAPGRSANILLARIEAAHGFSLVAVTRCAKARVTNGIFRDWTRYGVLMSSTVDGECSDSRFSDCAQRGAANAYAFSASGNRAAGFPLRRLVFRRNRISGVPSWDGFMSHECSGLVVADNIFEACRTGIDISTDDGVIEDVEIFRNRIALTRQDSWRGRAAVHAGILVQAEGKAPPVSGVTVADNVVSGANRAPGLVPAGSARGAFSFARVRRLRLDRNRSIDQGGSAPSYAGIAVFDPQANTRIDHTEVAIDGPDNAVAIEAREGVQVDGLVVTNLTVHAAAAGEPAVRLHKGRYSGLRIEGVVGGVRRSGPALTGGAAISRQGG